MFSFGIIAENFEVFLLEKDMLYFKVLWMVGEGKWNSVGSSFCDVSSVVSRSISWALCLPVVTEESGWARFLKNWHIS